MSGIYSLSLAAIALVLKLQVDDHTGTEGGFAFVAIAVLGWFTMVLVARTHGLAARQASYIEVYFERDAGPSWVTHSRAAWRQKRAPGAVSWTQRLSEQKLFSLLLLFAQVGSAWLLSDHYPQALPINQRTLAFVGGTGLLLAIAWLLPVDPMVKCDKWHFRFLRALGCVYFGVQVWCLFQGTLARFVGIGVIVGDLFLLGFATRDTSLAWTEMWNELKSPGSAPAQAVPPDPAPWWTDGAPMMLALLAAMLLSLSLEGITTPDKRTPNETADSRAREVAAPDSNMESAGSGRPPPRADLFVPEGENGSALSKVE